MVVVSYMHGPGQHAQDPPMILERPGNLSPYLLISWMHVSSNKIIQSKLMDDAISSILMKTKQVDFCACANLALPKQLT